MIQPQFIILNHPGAQWINLSEIGRAVITGNQIDLHLKNGTLIPITNKQDIDNVKEMLNRLSEIPNPLTRA